MKELVKKTLIEFNEAEHGKFLWKLINNRYSPNVEPISDLEIEKYYLVDHRTIGSAIAVNPQTPESILLDMIASHQDEVACSVAYNPSATSDMIRALYEHKYGSKRCMMSIAKSPYAPEDIVTRTIEDCEVKDSRRSRVYRLFLESVLSRKDLSASTIEAAKEKLNNL